MFPPCIIILRHSKKRPKPFKKETNQQHFEHTFNIKTHLHFPETHCTKFIEFSIGKYA